MSSNNKISTLVSSNLPKTKAFVYCWTDHKTNKLYVGSHKGSTEDNYICSSKIMKEEYKKRPFDFTRQIIATGNHEDIKILEYNILMSINAKKDIMFYNQHNGDKNGTFILKGHTEKTKEKMKKPKSLEHRKKLLGNKNSKGVIKSIETIEKTRLKNIGRKNSHQAIENLKLGQKRRYLDPFQKKIQQQAAIVGWETRRKILLND